jgi:hypothetical protein
VNLVHLTEHAGHQLQAARSRGQIDLGDVSGYHHLRAEAQPGQKHLHLLRRGVLRLVEHDERVIESAPAHVGERGHLDRARREQLGHDLRVHHLVECVVERAEVRIDLVGKSSGQVAEPLPRFDGGAGQDDAADLLALQRLDGLGHREIGLARARRADPEHDGVLVDRVDVLLLTKGLRADALATAREDRLAQQLGRAHPRIVPQDLRRLRHAALVQSTLARFLFVPDHQHQLLDEPHGRSHLVCIPVQSYFITSHEKLHEGKLLLNGLQQSVLGAEQPHHGHPVDSQLRPLCTGGACATPLGHSPLGHSPLGAIPAEYSPTGQGCLPEEPRRAGGRERGIPFGRRSRRC